jgi:hypothetical protein
MSDDGADLGIGAESALKVVLGGEPQEEQVTRTPAELRAMIEAVPVESRFYRPSGYGDGANATAKIVLHFLERHPECALMPAESAREWPKKDDGTTDWNGTPTVTQEGIYDAIKRLEPETYERHREHVFSELTGFMWGWAVNAAKYCLDLPPVPNPAIVEI